jgi:hypothetical protein
MINREVIGIIAGVLSLFAHLVYVKSILSGNTRPNRATWWVLTLIGTIITLSYYAEGARNTIWLPAGYTLGALLIALLSLRYGEGKWEKLDKWCLFIAIISALIWYISKSAILTLIINVAMDFIGLVPTIKKSYLRPWSEDRSAWAIESVAGILNVLAINRWTFGIAFYPIYLLTLNGMITILLYRSISKNDHRR